MKSIMVLWLTLLVPFFSRGQATEGTAETKPATTTIAVSEGWLAQPSHELVLDVQHESLEYGARRDAGEFLAAVLDVLLRANYSVRLSDEFMLGEINYYRAHASHEFPVETGGAVLSCLESARASGVLDWDCFRRGLGPTAEPKAIERHLPWMAPPFKAKAVTLAGVAPTNLACLHLSLKWSGRNYAGGYQHARRPGGLAGETVLQEGRSSLWAFAGVMRLTTGDQTLFEKVYPREDWQKTYVTIYEQPLWKTSQAILQDLATGLKPGPVPVEQPGRTKSGKRHKAVPEPNPAH